MAEYKCIGCGAVCDSKESMVCAECGFKMFRSPYDRRALLLEEIRRFLNLLMNSEVSSGSFDYFRHADEERVVTIKEAENRIQSFDEIKKRVIDTEKTEEAFRVLNFAISNIRTYISSKYEQRYIVDYDNFFAKKKDLEDTLHNALLELNIDCITLPACFPEAEAIYCEEPRREFVHSIDILLDALQELIVKIQKFIKDNNIYGALHSNVLYEDDELVEDEIVCLSVEDAYNNILKVLSKKYFVDIFSDGTEELQEMFDCIWDAFNAILSSKIFDEKFLYICNEIELPEDVFCNMIEERIAESYQTVFDAVNSAEFLCEKSEKDLFALYKKMIELDSHGFIGVDKSSLFIAGVAEEKLNELIGLTSIKESVRKIKAYILKNKGQQDLNLHMCFYGNPGSGKTEVARIIAGILRENKILPTDKVVEVDRGGLVGEYIGQTAQKTKRKIDEAMGGVLFVDEAYALVSNGSKLDYGPEAIATLIKAMEDYRGKFCVIFAGYKNEMAKLISSNPGFKSRIQFELDFPNYSRDELKDIARLMVRRKKYNINDNALERILDITDIKRREPNFANARELRNIIDGVIMCQSYRTIGIHDRCLGMVDVNKYIDDANIILPVGASKTDILSADQELDRLVGLDSVKKTIRKIRAFAKRNKDTQMNLHMCFYGNPGTGKTEVARIMSSLLYEAGVLRESKFVETDAHGLIGRCVGETAPKVREKIDEAMGGVLFIDEAYALCGNNLQSGYGKEAIEVLLKSMEDYRGRFGIIYAGYKDEMKRLIDSNPGFESRIQFVIDFPDYTREELSKIAELFLSKKGYTIEPEAMELLLDVTESCRANANFANARTIRNVLDQVIMNQNFRAEDFEDDYNIILEDVSEYIDDNEIIIEK